MAGRSTRSLDIIGSHVGRLSNRAWAIIIAVVCGALSLYFLMWTIQTAWLGSFPGRDIDKYTLWAFLQLAAALVLAGCAAVAILRARRKTNVPMVKAQ